MKTLKVTCETCGSKYKKVRYDLDLKVGDQVIYASWVGGECEQFPVTITDVSHKKNGLYWGSQQDVVFDIVHTNVRVDTRNYHYVKLNELKRKKN